MRRTLVVAPAAITAACFHEGERTFSLDTIEKIIDPCRHPEAGDARRNPRAKPAIMR